MSSLKTTVIIPKVATPKSFTWEKCDIEHLVDWMEDNLEALRGSRSTWIKDCKEQVFSEHADITTERIGTKTNNLKASWVAGKKKMGGTGWGVTEEGETVNQELEKKYPFYRRLDGIWGTRPNASLGTAEDTLEMSMSSPLPASTASTPGPTAAITSLPSTPMPDLDKDSDDEFELEATPSRRVSSRQGSIAPSKLPGPGRRGGSTGRTDSMKRLMEERQSNELERELKRAKVEEKMQTERLETKVSMQQERLKADEMLARISASTIVEVAKISASITAEVAKIQAEISASAAAEVAKIQADAQGRQMEFMAQMMGSRGSLGGRGAGGSSG